MCAFRKCRSRRNVKNVSTAFTAVREKVDELLCRRLSPQCTLVRFCCPAHKKYCTNVGAQRGQREGLDEGQVIWLFQHFLAAGTPWVAVLLLLQVVAGERATCMCNARRRWLRDLSPVAACPASLAIEKVNGKTRPRVIPLAASVAALLHHWISDTPLHGVDGSQWPFQGQNIHDEDGYLFPGLHTASGRIRSRDWCHPVTSRAYLAHLSRAASKARHERAIHREREQPHVFDDFPLDLLGTHSMKRTGLSIMKDVCSSTALVGAVAGTTAKTIDRVYDQPTRTRQQRLVQRAFDPMVQELHVAAEANVRSHRPGEPRGRARFCGQCGKRRQDSSWLHCPWCKHIYQ